MTAVFSAIFIIKKKIRDSKYNLDTPEGRKDLADEIQSKTPDPIARIIVTLAVVIVIFCGCTAAAMFDVLYKDNWRIFSRNRIKKVEKQFSITVDDSMLLEGYQRKSMGQMGEMSCLEFESTKDGEHFMAENCKADVIRYAKDNVLYTVSDESSEPTEYYTKYYVDSIYWYYSGNKLMCAVFLKDDNGCSVYIGDEYFVKKKSGMDR